MRNWFIKKLGGYTTEEFRELSSKVVVLKREREIPWDRQEVLTEAIAPLFNTLGEEDIFRIENGIWMYKGQSLNEAEIKNLKVEAQKFLKSRLFKLLKEELTYQANLNMFMKSKSEIDIIAGKLWVYTIETIESSLKRLV